MIFIYIIYDDISYVSLAGNHILGGGVNPCFFARGICIMMHHVSYCYHPHAWLVGLLEIVRRRDVFFVFRCKRNSDLFEMN